MTPFENISAAFAQGSWHAAALPLRAAAAAPFGAGFAVTNNTWANSAGANSAGANSTAERPVLLTHPMPHCISIATQQSVTLQIVMLRRGVSAGYADVPHLSVKEGAA